MTLDSLKSLRKQLEATLKEGRALESKQRKRLSKHTQIQLSRLLLALQKEIAQADKLIGPHLRETAPVSEIRKSVEHRGISHVVGVNLAIERKRGRCTLAWRATWSTTEGQINKTFPFGQYGCSGAWKEAVNRRKRAIAEQPSVADLRCPTRKKIIAALEERIGSDWTVNTYPPMKQW